VVLGVLALNEFVFIKSLGGSNYQMGLLFQFSMMVFLFLIVANEMLKRIENRKKLLRITALLTRLPLLLIFFFPHAPENTAINPVYHHLYLMLFLIYFAGNIVIYPNINFLLKINYTHVNFGKLYSYATSVNKLLMLVVTFVYGYLLDLNQWAFAYVLPVIGVLAVISVFILSLIKGPDVILLPRQSIFISVKKSVQEMTQIMKTNVPYRHFEVGFMLYGFSFMITYAVITIYFYEALNLNYTSVAFYRNSYNILAILLLPFFGKLLGSIDPRKFAAMTFASLGLYVVAVALTTFLTGHIVFWDITLYYTLIFYVLFQGIFASTMVLLWNIGSAYFCEPGEAGTYQSIHLSLTGARAILAPVAGVFFYEMFGFTTTFVISLVFVCLAILLMIWSYRRDLALSRITANASPKVTFPSDVNS
jgi:MFS family permease